MGGAAKVGQIGSGIQYTFSNGKTKTYYITADGSLRDIVSGEKANRDFTGAETAKRMIESGNGTYLSKSQINELRNNRLEDRKNTPDYETGNPFGERGRGKTVYRPRRNK